MTETTVTNVSQGRSGIGSAPLTVSVLNFDPTLGCDSATFQPCSDRALSSLKVVGDAFKELFPINQVLPANQSSFFGFFLEDQLLGGQVREQDSFDVVSADYGSRFNTLRHSMSQNRSLTHSLHGIYSVGLRLQTSLLSSSTNSTRTSALENTQRVRRRTRS